MPSHPTYEGPCKVRVLPPGVGGEDFVMHPRKLGMRTWGRPNPGYETVEDAGKRLGLTRRKIYSLCDKGQLEHIRVGRDRSVRVYIKQGAEPK